ncbi:MAG TPA: heavy-metal-associated domain-containing protein, partial [Clostridia bacterium]|nr:heavy-metal-associated domain-containing protein [Clostridia bacterium]
MTVLKVDDMHCGACVNRITKVLNAENIKFMVSLQDKTVTIEDDALTEKAIEAMDDA